MRDFHRPGRSTVYAANGMAATSHPLASLVAIETLKRGGNAADAAVAAAALLGICEPQMTGLGGDAFALVKPAGEERLIGLNGSGRAPAALAAADLRAEGLDAVAPESPHAITVPGAVAAFERLVADHGRLGLEEVLAPAIRYAEEGVPVAPRAAEDWSRNVAALRGVAQELFLKDGAAPRPGDIFRAPRQAEALRRIAAEGARGFYEGEVAEDMVAALNALGARHSLDDFAAARAEYVEPISGRYRDVEICELPANGQGAAALLMAAILERFELGRLEPFGAMRAHLEAEATKLAYDARNHFIGDPDTAPGLAAKMLGSETVDALAAFIDPKRAQLAAGGAAAREAIHKETVYLCVVDADRMAVSLIYSIFHEFGSGLASPKFGILFHNRGASFSLAEGHPNELLPCRRPMHTIIPAMLKRGGRVIAPFGVMGGQYQPAGHMRVVSNMVDFGLHPQAALDAPRSFVEQGALMLESAYDESVVNALEAKGHCVRRRPTPLGGAQLILIDHERGVLEGASDPRKDGVALGW